MSLDIPEVTEFPEPIDPVAAQRLAFESQRRVVASSQARHQLHTRAQERVSPSYYLAGSLSESLPWSMASLGGGRPTLGPNVVQCGPLPIVTSRAEDLRPAPSWLTRAWRAVKKVWSRLEWSS